MHDRFTRLSSPDLGPVDAVAPEGVEIVRAGGARIEHGGYAAGRAQRIGIEPERRMRISVYVQINQTRRDIQPSGVDHVAGVPRQRLVNRHNPVAADGHVAHAAQVLRRVDHLTAADENMVREVAHELGGSKGRFGNASVACAARPI